MNYSDNLKLNKPTNSDTFNIDHQNANMDIIDAKITELEESTKNIDSISDSIGILSSNLETAVQELEETDESLRTDLDETTDSLNALKEIYGETYISLGRDADSSVGTNSIAFGNENSSTNLFSVAFGSGNKSQGLGGLVEGTNNTNTSNSMFGHIEGGNNVCNFGNYTHVEGYNNNVGETASCSSTHVEGSNNTVNSGESHIEGNNNIIGTYSSYSHIEGNGNTVGDNCSTSHVEGESNKVLFQNTIYPKLVHIEGYNNAASSQTCHVEGTSNTINVSATNSHCEGGYNICSGSYQHVEGKYNVEDRMSKYAHIVGNGTSTTERSNAFTVDWDGNGVFSGDVTSGEGVSLNGLKTMVEECFQSVSDGKSLVASAITDKGVETAADATFETMANNIAMIESGSSGSDNAYYYIGSKNAGYVNGTYIPATFTVPSDVTSINQISAYLGSGSSDTNISLGNISPSNMTLDGTSLSINLLFNEPPSESATVMFFIQAFYRKN